jgi:hypothetical protein
MAAPIAVVPVLLLCVLSLVIIVMAGLVAAIPVLEAQCQKT